MAQHQQLYELQSHAGTWQSVLLKGDSQPSVPRDGYVKPLSTIQVMVAHTSVASSKPQVGLDSHAETCVPCDNYLVIHGNNRPVIDNSYNPKDSHRSAKTVDAPEGYQDPHSGQMFISMTSQAICINGLENNLICPMQCCLKNVHITEVPKFLTDSLSVTTHAIALADSFHIAHSLLIPL